MLPRQMLHDRDSKARWYRVRKGGVDEVSAGEGDVHGISSVWLEMLMHVETCHIS